MKTKLKTAYIEMYGCNRRNLDLSTIEKYLVLKGYKIINNPRKADLILLSTCAFKKQEEEESILKIKKFKNYNAQLLLYGCLKNIAPSKFEEFSNIDFIAPKDIDKIDYYFNKDDVKFKDIPYSNKISHFNGFPSFQNVVDRILSKEIIKREFYERSTKKILNMLQGYLDNTTKNYMLFVCRGCLGKCSYCAIKFAIGSVKSKQIETIVEELRKGIESGHKNFIILGDDPGCYGIDIKSNFTSLLSHLLNETNKVNRKDIKFHINEIHPKWLVKYNKELKEILKSRNVASILCPVQSGSDRILKLMQREHTVDEIRNTLNSIKRINPKINISTQIIVGFPSETEEEFHQTLELIKEMEFFYTVIFPYHEKENTQSSKLDNKISDDVVKKRLKYAIKFMRKKRLKVYTTCP